MAKKTKVNYAIVKTVFGDYWVGTTDLKLDKKKYIYKTENEAVNAAQEMFMLEHYDFDPTIEEDDDDYDLERAEQYKELADVSEHIKKGGEKFIMTKGHQ